MKRTKVSAKINIGRDEMEVYFREHYSYLDFDISDKELDEFLSRPYMIGKSIEHIANLLYDKLLAGGAYAQE